MLSEPAIVLPPPEQSKPKITTNAPTDAQVGDKIKDEAILTGPYLKGTQVEFWYLHTPNTNPDAARDQLTCAVPDPADLTGAVKIGVTTLDHDIADGITEKLYSPEFTSAETGCTWIKETAFEPGDGPNRDVFAEGMPSDDSVTGLLLAHGSCSGEPSECWDREIVVGNQ